MVCVRAFFLSIFCFVSFDISLRQGVIKHPPRTRLQMHFQKQDEPKGSLLASWHLQLFKVSVVLVCSARQNASQHAIHSLVTLRRDVFKCIINVSIIVEGYLRGAVGHKYYPHTCYSRPTQTRINYKWCVGAPFCRGMCFLGML